MENIDTQALALAIFIIGFAIGIWQMYKHTQH